MLDYISSHNINIPISIDTRSAVVAEECLKKGAKIINDVSGLKYDKDMASVIAKYNATLILQHSLGNEINMSEEHHYEHVVDDVFKNLYEQIEYAKFNGITDIIVDVGIGFDKSRNENLEILRRIEEFYALGYPIMTGISRKSTLGLHNASNDEKDIFTLALNTLAVKQKVDYLRVHNVKLHKQMLAIMEDYLR
ncbi:dihydropteroate synthase [bacterium]|nr:dihydropteroate synthase [bacterium]